jgi:hypothetical protein
LGLANRVAAPGQAEALARQLAAFPQECLRGDRQSAMSSPGSRWRRRLPTSGDTGSAPWPPEPGPQMLTVARSTSHVRGYSGNDSCHGRGSQ